tara:strand:+ start:81 stop:773 length:693 start_codon:yes stop_codon:yes gene_type:complete
MSHIYTIFPTTIYVGEVKDHKKHKEEFYKVYPKFDYEVNEHDNTVSENTGKVLLHLEDTLNPLFEEIIYGHVKSYICDILRYKDIFNYVIIKSWLSRARSSKNEIPWHIHSPSHISFCYYLNMPPNSHKLKLGSPYNEFTPFLGSHSENKLDERVMIDEYTNLNSVTFDMSPPEGSVVLFPSRIKHTTKSVVKDFTGERLAIVGDIILTLKEDQLQYSMGFIDPKYWKQY